MGTRLDIPECVREHKAVNLEELKTPAADLRPGPEHCAWTKDLVDHERLGERLLETMDRLPDYFQAVVVETTPTANGDYIASQRVLVHGAVDRPEAWHPGLSVSLVSAIGAVARLTALGLHGELELSFFDDGGTYEVTLAELLSRALAKGDPHAHNRLVQLAGTDRMHGSEGLLQRHALVGTTLKRAFDSSRWADLGQARGLRRAPRIVARRGKKAVELPASVGARIDGCDQEACTTSADLARAMCLVTQHARLPSSRRLPLGMGDEPLNLKVLRTALQRPKRHTPGHVEYSFMHKLSASKGYTLYRRSGREDGWSTFVLGVRSSKSRRDYVVVLAAHGSKRPLDEVAQTLAALLKAEDL